MADDASHPLNALSNGQVFLVIGVSVNCRLRLISAGLQGIRDLWARGFLPSYTPSPMPQFHGRGNEQRWSHGGEGFLNFGVSARRADTSLAPKLIPQRSLTPPPPQGWQGRPQGAPKGQFFQAFCAKKVSIFEKSSSKKRSPIFFKIFFADFLRGKFFQRCVAPGRR